MIHLLKSLLHILKNLPVLIVAGERDRETLGPESFDTMKARARLLDLYSLSYGGHIVVDHHVHFLNIDSAIEEIGGNLQNLIFRITMIRSWNSSIIVNFKHSDDIGFWPGQLPPLEKYDLYPAFFLFTERDSF